MPAAIAQKVKDLWNLDFIEGYGLSETIAASHANPINRPKQQCLGIPISGTDSRIIDPDTLEPRPQGETGEIITHGPGVFQGYWNDPEKTAAAFIEHDGKRFFRTGDLGRIDEEGFFFMVDRLKAHDQRIGLQGVAGGGRGDALPASRYPGGVRDRHVRPVPRRDGQGADRDPPREAQRRDRERDRRMGPANTWPRNKIPRIIEFVDALPKSGTGKVMWRALQEAENAKAKAV